MKQLRIETVKIKREEHSDWEVMISINEGSGPLIDLDGKIVEAPIFAGRDLNEQVMAVRG